MEAAFRNGGGINEIMDVMIDSQTLIHLIWSHGDCIPVPVRDEVVRTLLRTFNETQLRLECRKFIANRTSICEEKVDTDGDWTYNKIMKYNPVDPTISKYTQLARG